MFSRILSFLFPPKSGFVERPWAPLESTVIEWDEQGWAGNVKRKPFRNGIERYYATRRQYEQQMAHAQIQIDIMHKQLLAEGYINTMHDEYVKVFD